MHGHATRQLGDGFIADKAGFRDDDFIPGFDQCPDGQVDGLAAADGDQHLGHLILQVKAAFQIPADLGAQLLEAGIGRILGAALLQATDAGIPHTPGGLEIRFADAQGDAVRHIAGQVKELADAGGAHGLGGRGKQFVVIHHSMVHSLSSVSSA